MIIINLSLIRHNKMKHLKTIGLLSFLSVAMSVLSQHQKAQHQKVQPKTVHNFVTDIDGNSYKTVKIATQVWMAEDLKVTHYQNGEAIPNVTTESDWGDLSTGALCVYENDSSYVKTYGNLYNWYTVNDARQLAPKGWHIPSDAEWTTLTTYLGGEKVAGGKLREAGRFIGMLRIQVQLTT